MRINRDGFSTPEMEDLIRVREAVREGCRTNSISSEELAELVLGMTAPFASVITILANRRARLAKLLNAIGREREKAKTSLDMANLSNPENIDKVQRLEKLINDYCFLNEGLHRSRGGRRPKRTKVGKGGKGQKG